MSVYLFHSSLSLSTAARGIQYDEALRLRNEGHTIYFLYCNGLMTQCFENIVGNEALCYMCKSNFRKESKRFEDKINFVPLSDLIDNNFVSHIYEQKFNYQSVEDIKKLEYKNINIGLGALSGYITKSRNLNPLIDDNFRIFFDQNLYNSIITTESVFNAIEKYKPDHIVLYNGRFSDSKPIWQIAEKLNIPYTTLEAVYGVNKNYKAKYENSTAHSIDNNTKLINYFWDNSDLSFDAKYKIGSLFFERRKNAIYAGDKIYTKNQTYNLLPDNWDNTKKNIVIFNSSEDEFAAIGGEYEKYQLFNSQLEGIQFIKNTLKDNSELNITLRIHPNLSEVQYSYATDLLKLSSDNFNVINGNSKVSSYALLDNADIIIVFGSTIGIEAVYWNKPTILLNGAMYYKLDCCYIPASTDELISLIKSELKPKNNIQAIKFGYYFVNEEREGHSVHDYSWSNKEVRLLNMKKNIQIHNTKKMLGSKRLYSIYNIAKFNFINKFYSIKNKSGTRFILPIKEDISN